MKVLTVPPDTSHLAAMVPLCWSLRAAGHEVLVACRPAKAAATRATGLNAGVIDVSDQQDDEPFSPGEDMFPAEVFGQRDTEMGRFLWEQAATSFAADATADLDGLLSLARRWRPDIVLTDPMTLSGQILAGVLDVPLVSWRWGVDPTSGPFKEKAAELLASLCSHHGLAAVPEPDLLFDPCPRDLQVPAAPAGRPVRYVPHNGTGVLPDWVLQPAASRRVAVCMGSTVLGMTGPRPLANTLSALAGVPDVEIVVALSPAHRSLAGDVAANVRVVESLPLNLLLDNCDVVVHHGGSGSGLSATAYGVPQLALPQFADSFDYGRGLALSGAGINVPTAAGQSDVDGLTQSITDLLEKPDHRDAVGRLRLAMETAPALSTAVDDIEKLV